MHCLGWFQSYGGELEYDYITGAEEVGADPTAPVKAAVPEDTQEKADPAPDLYEFKEYDVKEFDKEFVEKPYDYGDYGDYGHVDAKPTPEAYEDFGPGVPAKTDFSESSVSLSGGGGVTVKEGGSQ